MPTEQEQAQELYDKLKPEAVEVYVDHIVSRTPPELQDEVRALAEADLPAQPDPNAATVTNGQQVNVIDGTGAPQPGSPGLATVNSGNFSGVQLGAVVGAQRQDQGRVVASGPIPQRQPSGPTRR